MDQLKAQLAVVLKYGFWITCSLVLIASLAIWYLATSKLADENQKQTSKINSAISQVSSVRSELPTLPNELSHKEMRKLIKARRDEVVTAWKKLYDRQRGILTWPVEELKADFVDEFEDLDPDNGMRPDLPFEVFVKFPNENEKETTLRTRYERYIKNVLPDIAKIAKAEWTAEFERSMSMDAMMGTMGGGRPMGLKDVDITGAEKGPLVQWSSESQQAILKDLFPWRGSLPTTLEVYYSQENIWILKQLLQIVADVNGDATQPYQAKIREIRQIGIGKSVKFGEGHISKPGEGSLGMMGGMMGGMMDEMMDMGDDLYDDMGGDMMGGGTMVATDPAENRYVNAALEPIPAATLRSALESNLPSNAALAVAKRVPVMMSLNMDQRAVHELIAACGNAPLMVEVHQVRLLPEMAGGAMGMGGMGDMGGEEMEMGMGMEMEMGGMGMGMGMGGMGAAALTEPVDETPLDMTVEIYGIIHIYNPPDPVKLGVEQVTEDTVMDGATETIGGEKVATESAAAPVEGELPTPPPAATGTPPAATGTTPDAPAPDAGTPAAPPATSPATPPVAPDTTPPATTPGDSTTEAVPPVAMIGN